MLISEYLAFLLYSVMSVCMMDDWKLKTTPVVKLDMLNKTFVPLFVAQMTVLGKLRNAESKMWNRKCGMTLIGRVVGTSAFYG